MPIRHHPQHLWCGFLATCAFKTRRQTTTAKEGDTKDADTDVATADFPSSRHCSDYHLQEGEDDPTEEELTAYAATTGRSPSGTQYVYDLTGRLALPPLTLVISSRSRCRFLPAPNGRQREEPP